MVRTMVLFGSFFQMSSALIYRLINRVGKPTPILLQTLDAILSKAFRGSHPRGGQSGQFRERIPIPSLTPPMR